MRFHGIMLMRDEDDIIGQSLSYALTWCDSIFVFDTGSTDNTWDIVLDMAKQDKRIIPVMRQPVIFNETLRGYVFNRCRDRMEDGDWVIKVDTDEFFHITPPTFIEQNLRPNESQVMLQWAYFRLTTQEVADYESGRVNVMEDRKRPIELRRQMYDIATYPEPRIFRYRKSMKWHPSNPAPYNTGYIAKARIPVRHYPHRDPLQMQKRFRLRMAMQRHPDAMRVQQWTVSSWRNELIDLNATPNHQSATEGLASAAGHSSGKLTKWDSTSPLDMGPPLLNHIPKPTTRMLQRMVYRPMVIPILDRLRPQCENTITPSIIPDDVNNKMGRYINGITETLEQLSW